MNKPDDKVTNNDWSAIKPNQAKSYISNIFMYKEDLALNNLQRLICHKTQPKPNYIYLVYIYKEDLVLDKPQWLTCHKTQPKSGSLASG